MNHKLDPPAIVREDAANKASRLFREADRKEKACHESKLRNALGELEARLEKGRILAEFKATCLKGSGQWKRFLEEEGIDRWTAEIYMRFTESVCGTVHQTDQERLIHLEAKWREACGRPVAAEPEPEDARPGLGMFGEDIDTEPEETPEPEPERVTPPVPSRSLEVVKNYYTLAEWQEMPEDRKSLLLRAPIGNFKFNDQGDNANIEWALWSWNPVTGCRHECPYCYARDIAGRFYEQKFEPSIYPGRLSAPKNTPFPEAKAREWVGHKNVFVCSMADLFGRWVPKEWIDAVLDRVRDDPRWNFLFLTKFPARMAEFDFPENAWVGTTVDCQARVKNAEKAFRKVKAGVKWLSVEPMLEPLTFEDIGAFHWVVIGGASKSVGGEAGPTPEWHPPREWIYSLEEQARAAGVKVYEKDNLLERIREYPGVERPGTKLPEVLRYLPMIG